MYIKINENPTAERIMGFGFGMLQNLGMGAITFL